MNIKKAKEDIFQRLDKMPRQKEAKKIKIAFRQIVQTEEGSDRMNDA